MRSCSAAHTQARGNNISNCWGVIMLTMPGRVLTVTSVRQAKSSLRMKDRVMADKFGQI